MAIYYVDAIAGNNSNSGLSESLAWQTIPRVNVADLLPGDSVLFKRGQTFGNYVLTFTMDGSANCPITFGAYGMGNKPVIDGEYRVACINLSNSHYLEFDNIKCINGAGAGVKIANNSSHINFTDCDILNSQNDNLIFINGVADCAINGGQFEGAIDTGGGILAAGIEIADNCQRITLANVSSINNAHVGLTIHSHSFASMPKNITVNNSTFGSGNIAAFQSAKQDNNPTEDLQLTFNDCVFNGLVEIATIGNVPQPKGYRFYNSPATEMPYV